MSEWPVQNVNDLNYFYGNPDTNSDGSPDLKWEDEYIMRIIPAYPMFAAWRPDQRIKTISINKNCAASLGRILKAISQNFDAQEREKYQLDRFGGAYNFRLMRGSHRLSVHSWGAAIDLAPELNPMGARWGTKPDMMPKGVCEIFANEGWTWLGPNLDGMHFQAAGLSH
jgi:hypothetical protein